MNKVLYIVIAFLMVSCYDVNSSKKPDDLISQDKMVDVIVDMSLLNSAKGVNKRLIENQNLDLKAFIYEKHNIDSLQFAESNTYYANRIDDYNVIYAKVKDSLTTLKDKYATIERDEKKVKRRKDSIRRAKRKDSVFKEKKGFNRNKKNPAPSNKTANRKVSKKPQDDQ